MRRYTFFNDNIELYAEMLKDIEAAEYYVYLETYIFSNDSLGRKFKRALLKKAKSGIEVKILVDGVGSAPNKNFFKELIEAGGEVRIFREFQWCFRIVKKNTFRDHRKLLVIDNNIAYIGSSNIFGKSLGWREANLRITGNAAPFLKKAFLGNFDLFDKHFFTSKGSIIPLEGERLEIIGDTPSLKFRNVRKRHLSMIKNAKNEIMIESGYFLPDFRIRKELKEAQERGVKVTVVVPKNSDVRLFDMLREKYLGKLHEQGINIMLFAPEVLHSKIFIVDHKYFMLGSSNMDHRSYTLTFEMNLCGTNHHIIKKLLAHFQHTLTECEPFDYKKWKKRSLSQRVLEKLLSTIRYSM